MMMMLLAQNEEFKAREKEREAKEAEKEARRIVLEARYVEQSRLITAVRSHLTFNVY